MARDTGPRGSLREVTEAADGDLRAVAGCAPPAIEPGARPSVTRQAIGRLIGTPPFVGVDTLSTVADATDVARRTLLDATGFERVAVGEDGTETWERPAGMRPRTGPERFLDRDGRIVKYPVRDAELRELLVSITPRVLAPGEVLTEHEINERIRPVAEDIALLRRHLVDHDLVERTRTGTQYALVEGVDNS